MDNYNVSFLFKSRLGLGTNRLGADFKQDLFSLHHALDIGYTVIDTAERYMNQASETIIGQCLAQRANFDRSGIQIITKVQPHNPIIESCLGSLKRLRCDYIDFYLLHWRENNNLESVINDMLQLQQQGYIKHYGVSNFGINDLDEWQREERRLTGQSGLSVNQIKYNFNHQSPSYALIPYHQQNNIVTIAHTPLDKGKVFFNAELLKYASAKGLTPAQAALHWILQTPGTVVIPKSTDPHRLQENFTVLSLSL